jgi:hypothetical protein
MTPAVVPGPQHRDHLGRASRPLVRRHVRVRPTKHNQVVAKLKADHGLAHGARAVFFSDLTRMFTKAGTSWTQLGVDFQNALRELHDGSFPALFLTITERMYLTFCDAATSQLTGVQPEKGEALTPDRELARQAITRQLASDRPAYMQRLLDTGRISPTR